MSSKKNKLILVVIAVVLVLGAGASFRFVSSQKKTPIPVVTTNIDVKDDAIDTSGWKLVQVPEVGFEMRMPESWAETLVLTPANGLEMHGFWNENAGSAVFHGDGDRLINVQVIAKKVTTAQTDWSDLSVGQYNLTAMDGYPAFRQSSGEITYNQVLKDFEFHDDVIVKAEGAYYYLTLTTVASTDKALVTSDMNLVRTIEDSFKSIPFKASVAE